LEKNKESWEQCWKVGLESVEKHQEKSLNMEKFLIIE